MKKLKFIENVKCSLSFSSAPPHNGEGLYECIENPNIKKARWVIAGNMVEKVPQKKYIILCWKLLCGNSTRARAAAY
jgi:hypothetical protein